MICPLRLVAQNGTQITDNFSLTVFLLFGGEIFPGCAWPPSPNVDFMRNGAF
jgi:hypothetical protein